MYATRALSPSFGAEVLDFDPSASQSEGCYRRYQSIVG